MPSSPTNSRRYRYTRQPRQLPLTPRQPKAPAAGRVSRSVSERDTWRMASPAKRAARLRQLLGQVANLTDDVPERLIQAIGDGLAAVTGWEHHHNPDSRRVAGGLPDSIYLCPPYLLLVEYKAAKGRIRPDQARWITKLGQVQHVVPVFIRPGDMPVLARALATHGEWPPKPDTTRKATLTHGNRNR